MAKQKGKKKKRTAKQIAATKRMIKARKKQVRAEKKAAKATKRKVKRAKRKAAKKAKKQAAVVGLGEALAMTGTVGGTVAAPKKKRRKSKKGKRKSKRTAKRKTQRRTKRKGGKRRKKRGGKRRGSSRRTLKASVRKGGKTKTVKLKGSPKVSQIVIQAPAVSRRRKKRKGGKKRKGKRKGNPINLSHNPQMLQANPSYGGLFSNAGPYTMSNLKNLGVVAVGVGLGLVAAEIVDRLVATRKPADSDSTKANHPWYGRNAVAAIQRRPDAMRYGAQVLGVGASLGLAYLTRNLKGAGRIIPFLAGGAAVAFAAKGVMMLFNWEVLPRIAKIKEPNEQTLANRIAVLEQVDTQDTVDKLFDKWAGVGSLAANQLETPTIQGPLSADTSQDILTLAGARNQQPQGLPLGVGGRPGPLVETGRVGQCPKCNGMNGCFQTCPEIQNCGPCSQGNGQPLIPTDSSSGGGGDSGGGGNGGGDKRCRYIVQPGDDIFSMARAAGVDMNTVNMLNVGTPDQYWIVGNRVVLPNAICRLVRRNPPPVRVPENPPPPVRIPEIPPPPPPPPPPPVTTTATPALPRQPPPAVRPNLTYDDVGPLIPSQPAFPVIKGVPGDDGEDTIL